MHPHTHIFPHPPWGNRASRSQGNLPPTIASSALTATEVAGGSAARATMEVTMGDAALTLVKETVGDAALTATEVLEFPGSNAVLSKSASDGMLK